MLVHLLRTTQTKRLLLMFVHTTGNSRTKKEIQKHSHTHTNSNLRPKYFHASDTRAYIIIMIININARRLRVITIHRRRHRRRRSVIISILYANVCARCVARLFVVVLTFVYVWHAQSRESVPQKNNRQLTELPPSQMHAYLWDRGMWKRRITRVSGSGRIIGDRNHQRA